MNWLFRIIALTIMLPIFGAMGCYSFGFLPYLDELKSVAQSGRDNLIEIEDEIYLIAVAADGRENIRKHAIKSAYWSIYSSKNNQKVIVRNLTEMLWYVSSYLHFDDLEIFHIWSLYAPYEKGRGLAKSSEYYFNKKLEMLTHKQLAVLIAVTKSPSRYKLGSAKLNTRVKSILERVETHK